MQEASTEDNPPVHQIGQSLRSSTSFTHNGANSSLTNRRERLLKILVVGDYAVGKTSLIRRYCEDFFSESYRITIGVDYHEKHFPDRSARVQLWDVAGHERFGNMTRTYYKYAVGAFVVYDITRPSSMEGTLRWWNDIRSKVELPDGSCIPAMLVGNKIDAIPVEEYERVYNEATKFASANGFVGFEAVSAKTAHNIPSGLDKLVVHAEASTNGLPMLTSSYENRMSSLKPNQRIDLIELRNPSTGRIQQLREKCCTPS